MLASLLRHHLLLQLAVSSAVVTVAAALSLPSLLLYGLHTYIYPDQVPGRDGTQLAIRRPSAADQSTDLKRRPRRNSSASAFDDSKAQLLRLRLSDASLHSRIFFPAYRGAFLSSAVALTNLVLLHFLPPLDPSSATVVTSVSTLASFAYLLLVLFKLCLERSAAKRSDRELSLIAGFLGFFISLFMSIFFSPSIFDFNLGVGAAAPAAAIAGILTSLLFVPSSRAARAFWIGTNQLRWNLAVVSSGTISRVLLYAAVLSSIAAPLLWITPVAVVPAGGDVRSPEFMEFRVWSLFASAVLQLAALRPHVQIYLHEAVFCWYQRLHGGLVTDMDYGRAKVFLHNHYLCLVVLQFFAPPLMVLLLLGLSQIRGNMFGDLFLVDALANLSDPVKEMALFLSWWIMFVWSVLTMLSLALYRYGFIFVS